MLEELSLSLFSFVLIPFSRFALISCFTIDQFFFQLVSLSDLLLSCPMKHGYSQKPCRTCTRNVLGTGTLHGTSKYVSGT